MIRGLLILTSSINGSRDLWWPQDPKATHGYNIYRAFDAPVVWQKINAVPVPGQYFRDQTTIQTVQFTVTPDAWIDNGTDGMRCFRIPDTPYSEVVKGRPTVATNPDDVSIQLTDNSGNVTQIRPVMVSGMDQTIWLPVEATLPTGGAVTNFPSINYDTLASVQVTFRKLVNYVDIATNMTRTFYTVVPITERGEEHTPGLPGSDVVDSMQVDRIDYMFAEMVRRNAWMFEQVGEPAHLLFRRTAGERCGCSSDFTQGRTACPICYETGIKGGYYGPIDILFIDPDQALVRTIDEGGQKVERKSRSYLGRTPIVQDGDMIVRRNGERLVISGVTYKMPRGVLLQQEFDVALLPSKDTRYLIPLFEPVNPLIYNPIEPKPALGAQPVYEVTTVKDKYWENKEESPTGRTVTFGRIQS